MFAVEMGLFGIKIPEAPVAVKEPMKAVYERQ